VPGKRQTGVREQLLCRQIARLASFDNRLGNVRGEIAEADNPSEIGSAHSFAQSKCRKGDPVALDEPRRGPRWRRPAVCSMCAKTSRRRGSSRGCIGHREGKLDLPDAT